MEGLGKKQKQNDPPPPPHTHTCSLPSTQQHGVPRPKRVVRQVAVCLDLDERITQQRARSRRAQTKQRDPLSRQPIARPVAQPRVRRLPLCRRLGVQAGGQGGDVGGQDGPFRGLLGAPAAGGATRGGGGGGGGGSVAILTILTITSCQRACPSRVVSQLANGVERQGGRRGDALRNRVARARFGCCCCRCRGGALVGRGQHVGQGAVVFWFGGGGGGATTTLARGARVAPAARGAGREAGPHTSVCVFDRLCCLGRFTQPCTLCRHKAAPLVLGAPMRRQRRCFFCSVFSSSPLFSLPFLLHTHGGRPAMRYATQHAACCLRVVRQTREQ